MTIKTMRYIMAGAMLALTGLNLYFFISFYPENILGTITAAVVTFGVGIFIIFGQKR